MSNFYARLRERRGDDDELAACIERVVNQLESAATTDDRPGILLVVKINRMSPTRRESFQSLVVFSMGSKRLILSTRTASSALEAIEDFPRAFRVRS